MSDQQGRLLFLAADTFPPFRVDVAVLFGRKLAGRFLAIDWLLQSTEECGRPYQAEWRGGTVWVAATDHGGSAWRRLRKHLRRLGNELRVLRLAGSGNYRIIQVKDLFLSAVVALIAARRNGCAFVYWLSYPFPEASIHEARSGTARYPWFYLFRGGCFTLLLYRLILPAADLVFVQSQQMKKDLVARGADPEKLVPVPMGVEIESIPFQPDGDDATTADKPVQEQWLLYLGTLARVRRLDFLIRVFARVWARQPQARLYLVGGGEDPADERLLWQEAERLGVARKVVMTGFLPMARAWEYVRQAAVCLSPYYPTFVLNSTSPTKLIEYMAMAKPVVANDHPEQRLVIEESGGGIWVPYQEQAFAEAVLALLAAPVEAAAMGRAGRAYVEKHRDYQVIAAQVAAAYQRLDGVGRTGGVTASTSSRQGLSSGTAS